MRPVRTEQTAIKTENKGLSALRQKAATYAPVLMISYASECTCAAKLIFPWGQRTEADGLYQGFGRRGARIVA